MVYKRKKEKEIFKDNFCPGDTHMKPIIPIVFKNVKAPLDRTMVEGQFDDD